MKIPNFVFFITALIINTLPALSQKTFNDTISGDSTRLIIHVLGHSSVFIEYDTLNVYIDPYATIYNFTGMPKADLILVTHGHSDHFDISAIDKIKQNSTLMIYPQVCASTNKYTGKDTIMSNGDTISISGLKIRAIPAYNLTKTQHPKGVGNGYVIKTGNKQIYFAGDTEKVPEMTGLKNIDFAFVGYSQPYNMTADSILAFCKTVKPRFLIPYHYDSNDPTVLLNLMKSFPETIVLTDQASVPSALKTIPVTSDIKLYPNPVDEYLTINIFEEINYEITDLKGQMMMKGITNSNAIINTSELKSGVYFLKTGNSEKVKILKFIKVRH